MMMTMMIVVVAMVSISSCHPMRGVSWFSKLPQNGSNWAVKVSGVAIFAQCDGHIISKTKLPGFCPVLCFTKCYTISFLFCILYYKDFFKFKPFRLLVFSSYSRLLVLNPPEKKSEECDTMVLVPVVALVNWWQPLRGNIWYWVPVTRTEKYFGSNKRELWQNYSLCYFRNNVHLIFKVFI